MSGRGHVDVNERRLRPIYDCLDSGNNKKAIQEADRLLKKQKDLHCAKVLRSLALIRLGRQDETIATLQEVHAQHPHDEHTLQAMAMCYRDVYRLDLIADMYENAHKCKPDSEEILNALFMAYVRLGIYKKQQQVAMALHKLRPQKNPYYFWAVMSIVMQAQEDEKLGKAMFLPLAEKMTLKYIQEGKLEAEAEVRLFLIILQCMGKYQEALDVLKGPLAVKLTSEPDFSKFLEAELLTKLQRWPLVNALYKQILMQEPEHWKCYKEYFNSAFHLIDAGWSPEVTENGAQADSIDYTVDHVITFITSLSSESLPASVRGPFLAQLELKKRLKERGDERWEVVFGRPVDLFRDHLAKFDSKPCCYLDLHLYTDLLPDADLQKLLADLLSELALGTQADGGDFVTAKDPKVIQRHLTLLQLHRSAGLHHQMSANNCLALVTDLFKHYEQGLSLGATLLTTDLQYVDNYMVLLVHILYDTYADTGDDRFLWQSIVLLEKALTRSPSNFQFKLLLVQLYARLGSFSQCSAFYNMLDIKHIQNDSLGYIINNHVLRLGHVTRAGNIYDSMLKFFMSVHKDSSIFLALSMLIFQLLNVCSRLLAIKSLGAQSAVITIIAELYVWQCILVEVLCVPRHMGLLTVNMCDGLLCPPNHNYEAPSAPQPDITSTTLVTSDFLISSYKYGSFPKVQEFVNFKSRLQNSIQFATAMVEKLLLDIISTPDNHKTTQTLLSEMAINPLVEKTDFHALRDNRDCNVFIHWSPPQRLLMNVVKEQSFIEEKSWLRLRNLVARCLVAAGRVEKSDSLQSAGNTTATQQAVTDSTRNGETATTRSAAVDVVHQLTTDLSNAIEELHVQFDSQKLPKIYPLLGPFRTRLIPYLRLGLGRHLVELLTMLTNLDSLREDGVSEVEARNDCEHNTVPSMDLLLSIQDLVVKSQLRLSPNTEHTVTGVTSIDVAVLENFILISEAAYLSFSHPLSGVPESLTIQNVKKQANLHHVCFVTVVMGACQTNLKPIKAAMIKRGKKKRETDPRAVSMCNYFTGALDVLVDITQKLLDAFQSAVVPGEDFTARLGSLSIDGGISLPRDEEAERRIADKVRASYHQTSCEMMELLRRKQRYLESIRL